MQQPQLQKQKILVTAAAGKTGSAVASLLLQQGWPVRALVRAHDARSESLALLGAEVVVADSFDPDQLARAIKGTSRAYYVPIMHPHMTQSAMAFATAAQEAKLEYIVQMSQWLSSPSHPSLMTRQTWLVDRLFASLPGIAHTIVNPGYFADNYLRLIDFASLLGVFPVLTGNSRNAPPSNEDIARVAVAALIDPARHAGKRYRPTGPQLLSAYDMAAILERVLNRRVRTLDMPLWMLTRAARMQGVDPFLISGLRYYVQDHRQGAFELSAPTNDVFEVTGHPAEDFETTARRYAAWPKAQPTLANKLRAFAAFLSMPLRPGYNLDRFDCEQRFPMPPAPRFAMEDEQWRAAHEPQSLLRTSTEPATHFTDPTTPQEPVSSYGFPRPVGEML